MSQILPEYLTWRADRAVFGQRPMLMVPRAGTLPEAAVGETRLLAAADGVYVETRALTMHAVVRLASVAMPYGEVTPCLDLAGGRLPSSLVSAFVRQGLAASPDETAALVTLGLDGRYVIHEPEHQVQRPGTVTSSELDDDSRLVFDLHTHGTGPAFFSGTDDRSDRARMGPYVALVVGHLDGESRPSVRARLCLSPWLIDIDPRWVIDAAGLDGGAGVAA